MHIKSLTLAAAMLLSANYVHAQEPKKVLMTDNYKGSIEIGPNDNVITTLALNHERYHDMGTFTLRERDKDPQAEIMTTEGDWTVLKGAAGDENATVIELNGHGRMLYYQRLKNGNLQQLDFNFHIITPVTRHILHKM